MENTEVDHVIHAGWATKEGGGRHSWRRRFFVLRNQLPSDDLGDYDLPPPDHVSHLLLCESLLLSPAGGDRAQATAPSPFFHHACLVRLSVVPRWCLSCALRRDVVFACVTALRVLMLCVLCCS